MKRGFWIAYRIVFGVVQLCVVIYVLAALNNDETRLIVAVLGLIYVMIANIALHLIAIVLQMDIIRELQFHELMLLANPKAQAPGREAELTIIRTNKVTQVFFMLISLICLLTVFGSLK